jgi:ATP-dependent helicase/nuclease subunit A
VTVVHVAAATADAGERLGGAAFGALVHIVLAQAGFDATLEQLEDLAAVEARVLGLSDDAAAAAARTVRSVLGHDLLRRARTAEARGVCRRETPVTCTMPDGTLVEGVVDLAFEEDGSWVVVDYKTDRELAVEGEARYGRQVALYATAIARATGSSATAILLRL